LFGARTGRIVKGDNPANLLVPRTTKIEMIVYLSTERVPGHAIPLPLVGRHNEAIE